jgi:transglutaminase-like putative cysteine protease
LKELEDRLKKATEDRRASEEASREAEVLRRELESTRKALAEAKSALEEARKRIEREEPLLPGRDYVRAVQPRDPVVRDFAVQLAKEHPGAYDDPQGSRIPSEAGLRQIYRIHQFVSSQWRYVSDPNVNWFDYASPARRTLAVGLAGDCDDFAILLSSLVSAIGARVRILHGYTSTLGHAVTEVWMGRGAVAQQNLNRLKTLVGSSASTLEYHLGTDGSVWLITDWTLGKLSIRPQRMEVAWQSD